VQFLSSEQEFFLLLSIT